MDDVSTFNSTPPSQGKKILLWVLIALVIVAATAVVFIFINPKNIHKQTVKAATEVAYFSVVSVSPNDNSSGNTPNSPITVTFSQAVAPDTLRGYFTVSPMVPGTFNQGQTPQQVVFTPKFSFKSGTSVKVILNQGFESVSGAKFNTDYSFNFYTEPLDDGVSFVNGNIISVLSSTTPNNKITFNLQVGSLVDPGGSITLYKGSVDQLLSSLAYTNQTNQGTAYVSQNFINNPVDTSGFQKISTTNGLSNQTPYTFNQGPGLYYIEADSKGGSAGFTWINVTDQGLITRQDDQQINIATQNLVTGDTNQTVKVSLYNLENKPNLVGSSDITSSGSIPVTFPQVADLLIGDTADGVILVPLSVPQTQSDIRVNANLSSLSKIFLYTDRPTYTTQDTIQFSGIVRLDNDAQYSLPQTGQMVRLWIPDPNDITNTLLDEKISVNAAGVFSGHFTVPAGLLPASTDNTSTVTLYAQLLSDNNQISSLRSYTTFDVVGPTDSALLKVSFDKSEYIKNETVVAHISATDSLGKALANQAVTYDEYLKSYYDSDPASVANFGTDWGAQTGTDKTVTLDSNGKADVTLDKISGATSEAVTIEANIAVGGNQTYGAKTVLIRQGNIVLSFGTSKKNYQSGDTTITRVYARDLQGNPQASLQLNYEFYYSVYDGSSNYNETTIATGTAQTDSNGFALIQQPVTTDQFNATIRVQAQDNLGNTVEAEQTYNFTPAGTPTALYYHDPSLTNLDVITDKQTYDIGDTADLVINSPSNENVWLTYERGRVYHSGWLQLQAGNNNYQIPITAQLSPSFNLVFSYFQNGSLDTEGLPIAVNDVSKNLTVTDSFDKTSYAPKDNAVLTINTKDHSGNPLPANVSITVVDDSIFNLRNTLPSNSIYWDFFMPRDDTTNFSSSTLGIGTGDGCGGGGDNIKYVPNRLGSTVYWNPNLATDSTGQIQITLPLPSTTGSYRVLVKTWTESTAAGQSDSTIMVQ